LRYKPRENEIGDWGRLQFLLEQKGPIGEAKKKELPVERKKREKISKAEKKY